jgi:DNA-binding MarR family transcriptional regulator
MSSDTEIGAASEGTAETGSAGLSAAVLGKAPVPAEKMAAWRALLQAHAALVEILSAEMEETHGISLTAYEVLMFLAQAPDGQMRMHELARSVLLTRSGLSRLVDRMEGEGLIIRRQCPQDRRGLFAVLTLAGRLRLRQAAPTHMAGILAHFASVITKEEGLVLAGILQRIADTATSR